MYICEFASGETVTVTVGRAHGELLASTQQVADLKDIALSDEILLSFCVEEDSVIEICGLVERNCETTQLRHITLLSTAGPRIDREQFFGTPPIDFSLAALPRLNIGTTGVCNASCIHCPTNKPGMRQPSGRMDMGLFRKLLDELAEGGFAGEISFALFAEPLDDPLLIERLHLIKRMLPSAISIATNCALFDRARHGEIVNLADNISIHIETPSPKIIIASCVRSNRTGCSHESRTYSTSLTNKGAI